MKFLGNIITHYNYATTDILQKENTNSREITSTRSKFKITIDKAEEVSLPDGSPFADWKEARRFAGPLPFTYSYNSKTKEVLIIEGVRQEWVPSPVKVIH